MSAEHVVVYGDFNCPWSYLASGRAAALASEGVTVDWRAVEHAPWRPGRFPTQTGRFACLREEMDRVLAELLPGEELPYSLAGFVPHTRAAVSGYAEAYAAGVADRARRVLFEAFWLHALDLGDAHIVRTLLRDAVRRNLSPRGPITAGGPAVDVAGGAVTTTARRLSTGWDRHWRGIGQGTVPVVLVGDAPPLRGLDAVRWLGHPWSPVDQRACPTALPSAG